MGSQRVLIIDDDPDYRRMLARFFQERAADIEVVTAPSGVDGLRECARKSPEVVLLDLSLKDMNGFDVLRRLRAEPATAQTKVLVITGILQSSDLLRSAALGLRAQDFIEKPQGPQVIIKRVRALLPPRVARAGDVFDFGRLKIDAARGQASFDGVPVRLSRRQFELLRTLAESRDGMSLAILKDLLWGPDASPNTVTKTANRLRASLPFGSQLVVAIPGGYKLAKLS